jgi:hypothetical protein
MYHSKKTGRDGVSSLGVPTSQARGTCLSARQVPRLEVLLGKQPLFNRLSIRDSEQITRRTFGVAEILQANQTLLRIAEGWMCNDAKLDDRRGVINWQLWQPAFWP